MSYIEKMTIQGFKKFKDFEIVFNKDMNVLVGENEAGKSTILEAIDLALNQKIYGLIDGNNEQLFNADNIKRFKNKPEFSHLPEILVEVYLNMDSELPISKQHFMGLDYTNGKVLKEEKTGIKFWYHFDNDFEQDFYKLNFSENPNIPIEFYKFEWLTFQGGSYKRLKNPIKSLFIDNSSVKNDLYGSYTKQVFENKIPNDIRRKLSMKLKTHIADFLDSEEESLKIGEQTISIDEKKSGITKIIDIRENNISIQHMGKGRENFIKTEVALQIDSSLILVEEPENHLSHSMTKKLIEKIKVESDNSQIIITTHNPLITSRLNIQKTIWITPNEKAVKLNDVDKKVAKFFEKSDNSNLLEFILSQKVILVEGATEYIYIPNFYHTVCGKGIDESGVHIISMSGITYKNYVEIAKKIQKPLLVITDNDGDAERITTIDALNNCLNENGCNILIKCDEKIENSTFERVLFNENIKILADYKKNSNVSTIYKEEDVESKALAYMLKNKADSAIEITTNSEYIDNLKVPMYISEGLKWLNQVK
ncbi:ATP-dependent nuclease [Enterococcus xiangfangensis]|uniref:ATP-dependent nuclease n=1 Tax=Enterococcus xiangfangensis TaxID=1296537 RepID=UPI0010F4DAD5|nr:TOPRIM nucleotidyl transferase/hydrolase domain-containing protein [Enterococcus xiangfangensis]MBM7711742.1 putative ATP-dependent endonuclease of OLD family [Enterococcus xiangfangensis]